MKYIYKIFLSILITTSFFAPTFALRSQAQIPPEQNPIVIVPGIMGSWNWDVMMNRVLTSNWNFFVLDHTFDNLIQALEDEGFVRDENLFVAFYDWRQGNATSSVQYLTNTINLALANSQATKVDIVAHSMGGLVARSYIQSNGYQDNVDNLILLGTPNYGSSDVYSLWEGGLVPKNWDKVQQHMIKFYLWYMTTATGQTSDFYDAIHEYIPSVGELLPTYDYIVDNTGNTKPVGDMIEQNQFLNSLNTEEEITELLNNLLQTTVIAGTGENTVNQIPVVDFTATSPSDAKLWADGIPEPNPPAKNDTVGDNRVLESSAFLPDYSSLPFPPTVSIQNNLPRWLSFINKLLPIANAFDIILPPSFNISQFTLPSKHSDLPTTSIADVFDTLGISTTQPLEFTPVPEPQELFSIWIASPVAVTVTDSDGNTVSNSKDFSNIPGAIYDGESDPAGVKMIIIPDPQDGDYNVSLTGIDGGGIYHMAVSHFSDTGDDVINTVEGEVEQDENINYTVTLDSSAPIEPITIVIDEQEESILTEEMSICGMIESLITDTELRQGSTLIENKTAEHLIKHFRKILKKCDKFEEKIEKIEERDKKHKEKYLEKEHRKFEKKTIHNLKTIIHEIKKAEHKDHIDESIAGNLIQKMEEIIDEKFI
jgi:pimeloyl-ACP methyl ester carboxylesterase